VNRKIALRSLKNLCAFIGAIVLFSYFANWAVDLRHWYVTLSSAFVCAILWIGFYVIEVRGGITQVALGLSRSLTKAELSPTAEPPAADPPSEVAAPNPLPWVNPKESARAAGK